MEVIIQRDYEQMSKAAAQIVAEVLNTKPNAVLGLATGSTPLGLYRSWCGCTRRRGSTSRRSPRSTSTSTWACP